MEPIFDAHVFICTNDRGNDGKRPSCAHRGSNDLRDKVKTACRGLGKVRVNSAGCLDQCEEGVAVVVYPSGNWLLNSGPADADKIVEAVKAELARKQNG
jgi:(2Fe-2S) ferredoxin